MKTIIKTILMILAATPLTGCDWSEDIYYPTEPGKTVYDYTKESLERQTDILTYAYQLNQYIKQSTTEGRDSVKELYFPLAEILSDLDPLNDSYTLRPADNGSVRYSITVSSASVGNAVLSPLGTPGAAWKLQATIISGRTTYYHNAIITDTDDGAWKVSESSSIPKCLYYFDNQTEPEGEWYAGYDYRYAFSTRNGDWLVRWSERDHAINGVLTASGNMESVASPKMRMTYETLEGIRFRTIQYGKVTEWFGGKLKINVDDIIDHCTDEVIAAIGMDEVSITFKGKNGLWEAW